MPHGYLGLTVANEAISQAKRKATEETSLGGVAGEGEIPSQTSPANGVDTENYVSYDLIGVSNIGLETYFFPSCFDGTNWNTMRWVLGFQELYASKWPLQDIGSDDYELQDDNGYKLGNMIDAYTQKIYDNGLGVGDEVPGTSYTLDNLNGLCQGYTPVGILRYEGFWLRQLCSRYQIGSSSFKFRDDNQNDPTRRVYSLLNPSFDLWTDSSTTKGWTKNGNVATTRITANFQGLYAMRLSNSSTGANYISQTISLSSTVTQATIAVMMKVTRQAKIGISLDGAKFNYTNIDVISGETDAVNKWIILYCESPTGSSSDIYVRIYPQNTPTDTGTVDIEGVIVVDGEAEL